MFVDVAGVALALREAAVSLGAATLQLRAGEYHAAAQLVRNALQRVTAAEVDVERLSRTDTEDAGDG